MTDFYQEVKQYAIDHEITLYDALLSYCEEEDLTLTEIIPNIKGDFKKELEIDCKKLNLVK